MFDSFSDGPFRFAKQLEKLEKDQKAEEEEDASRLLSMKKSKEKAKAGSRR